MGPTSAHIGLYGLPWAPHMGSPMGSPQIVRALAAEQHEEWQEGSRYLNMTLLKEQKKAAMHAAA